MAALGHNRSIGRCRHGASFALHIVLPHTSFLRQQLAEAVEELLWGSADARLIDLLGRSGNDDSYIRLKKFNCCDSPSSSGVFQQPQPRAVMPRSTPDGSLYNDWHEPQMRAAVCGSLHLSRSMHLLGDATLTPQGFASTCRSSLACTYFHAPYPVACFYPLPQKARVSAQQFLEKN